MRAVLDSGSGKVELTGTHQQSVARQATSSLGGFSMMFIVEKTTSSDETLYIQGQRGDITKDATVIRIADESGLMVQRLPDDAEVIKTEDGTGGQSIITTPLNINAARTVDFGESSSFTNPAITDLNVVQTSPLLRVYRL